MKKTKRRAKLLLLLLVLCISVGYAVLQSNLTINGTAGINNPTWDIHWENVQVTTGSVTGSNVTQAATIDNAGTTVNYTITLPKPGDFYEFSVDAVNDGTIDAMIDTISSKLNGTEITTLPNYLNYTITYLDGVEIEQNQELKANESETYKVRIEFKKDITNAQFPTTAQTLILSFSVAYKQATDNSISVRTYLYRSNVNNVYNGDNISELGTYYTTYQDVVSNTGLISFLRHRIINNQIVKSDVGFVYNNKAYYLISGGATYNSSTSSYNLDSIYYETNKATVDSVFGASNCTEYDEDYICAKDGYMTIANKNGYVYAFHWNDGWYCVVQEDNHADCYYGE